MNIYVTSPSPHESAKYLFEHNKLHEIDKSIIFIGRIMTTMAVQYGENVVITDERIIKPFKPNKWKHPIVRWVSESRTNAEWCIAHLLALLMYYEEMTGKKHRVQKLCNNIITYANTVPIREPLNVFINHTPFKFLGDDVFSSYRKLLK